MAYTHLDPGQELEISAPIYFSPSQMDISELVKLSPEQLKAQEADSVEQEKAIFEKFGEIEKEWAKQAMLTLSLRKAQQYLKVQPAPHTSNQWIEGEHDWHEISNMVYKMTCSVSKNTIRYGKGKIPTTRWQVSWSLMFNSPRKPMDYRSGWQIAGQHDKCYMDKAEMEKYLRGRIKAYSHLFTEISPPIPKKDQKHFLINGTLFKGYTVESPELFEPDKEQVDDLLSLLLEEDISGKALEPPPAQPEEKTPEAVWSKNRRQRQRSGKTPQPPAR